MVYVKMSKTSKLGCRSWSTVAGKHCLYSMMENGEIAPVCAGCYAKGGNYRFKNVMNVRENNARAIFEKNWVSAMVAEMSKDKYFRWFDSGDIRSPLEALRILQVMTATAWCRHWLPTRSHKNPKIDNILRKMEALPNVRVRRSSDSIDGTFTPGVHGSTVVPYADSIATDKTTFVCTAPKREGKCDGCRVCFSKHPVVAYVAHGQKMGRMVKEAFTV